MLRELDASHIVDTMAALQRRIDERFEDSSLGRVASELGSVADEAATVAAWLTRPIWALRVLVALCVALLLSVLLATADKVQFVGQLNTARELVPFFESLINDIVFVGCAASPSELAKPLRFARGVVLAD